MVQEIKGKAKFPPADRMIAKNWNKLLPISYSMHKEGCNNEFIRNFGNTFDEYTLNRLSLGDDERLNTILIWELDTVLSRLSRCAVGLLSRCDESKIVFGYYFPWMDMNEFDCRQKVNEGKVKVNKTIVDEASEEAILRHNVLDQHIYQFVEMLFEEQLRIAKEAQYNRL